MLDKSTRHAPARRSAPPAPVNDCERLGCRRHIARLEQFNRQLAEENDRLRRELAEESKARRAA
jgi:hypothetical protein